MWACWRREDSKIEVIELLLSAGASVQKKKQDKVFFSF